MDNLLDSGLANDPMRQQLILDAYARQELSYFTTWGLGFTNSMHHLDWYDILQDRLYTKPGSLMDSPLIRRLDGGMNTRVMLMAPRSHSKSTSFTVNYPLFEIGNNPNVRILIVSASGGQSMSFLREIKGHIERNANYRRIFGDLFPPSVTKAEKWTSNEIIVRRTNYNIKDPTVSATSAGGTILSKRADIIICDDILDENNTRTHAQRDKMREWFFTVLMPVLEPNGKMIVVGTAWNTEDLYHELMGIAGYDVRRRDKAIINDEQKIVLWPDRWSYDSLMERKAEAGSQSFNKSYQNEAISDENAIFKDAWLTAAIKRGTERTLIYKLDYSHWDLGGMKIVLGVDLAISQKDSADDTAFAVIGELENGDKIPLHLSKGKYSLAQTESFIIELNKRYRPQLIMVENNGYQEALRRDLADKTSLPIRGYSTGGEKYDENVGLNSLAVEFENGKWILPYSSESPVSQKIVDDLVEGMHQFPNGHTADILMATWLANGGLRSLTYTKQGAGTARGGKLDIYNRNRR